MLQNVSSIEKRKSYRVRKPIWIQIFHQIRSYLARDIENEMQSRAYIHDWELRKEKLRMHYRSRYC